MKTRNAIAMLAALAVVPLAAFAITQQEQERRGPPPDNFQGPGGPPRGPRPPMMGGPMMEARVLMRPEVQKELKLTDEQKDQIRELLGPMGPPRPGGDFGGRPVGIAPPPPPPGDERGGQPGGGPPPGGEFGDRPGGGGPPPPGGDARPTMRPPGPGQMDRHGVETDQKLKKILDERQYKRYKEIALQQQGPSALSRKDIADKVGLSEAQREKIRDILEKGRPTPPPPPREGEERPDFDAMRKRMDEAREKNGKLILEVLTADQRSKWNDMLGKPFHFQQPKRDPRRA